MNRHFKTFGFMAASALAAIMLLPAAVAAQDEGDSLEAHLMPLNDSGASGSAMVELQGSQVTVTVHTSGVSANLPHAQHVHIGGNNVCPSPSASGDDNLITTAEGQPSYGMVQISLTTEGDATASSALAVDRFPAGDASGGYMYQRTFDLPEGVQASDLHDGVIVVHGFAGLSGDETMYDGDQVSSLDESLPLEATIPVLCGELATMNGGGAGDMAPPATGTGLAPTDANDNQLLPLLGGIAAVVAIGGAGSFIVRRNARIS